MSAAIGWNRRMHPSTNDRLPLLGSVVGWPHSPRPPFKTYQGTAHAVSASAVAAHPARSRADAEQHGLLSILDLDFRSFGTLVWTPTSHLVAPTPSNTGCSRFLIMVGVSLAHFFGRPPPTYLPKVHLRVRGGGHAIGGDGHYCFRVGSFHIHVGFRAGVASRRLISSYRQDT